MTNGILADFFGVKTHFQRSIHLSKDWNDQRGIQEYLLSPTAEEITKQIILGLKSNKGPKAWSITGPYGTGKSAFTLFLTDLLANKPSKHSDAKELKKTLRLRTKPFIPILIVGQRNNIIPDLILALEESIRPISKTLANKARRILKRKPFDNREIVSLFEETSEAAKEKGYGGIIIIVDEFGKYLEYAANNPDKIDILFLQDLAETASRSKAPILLITILHSAFADYLTGVDEARRAEWQKVQGRYADLSFLEPPEQFLILIGSALDNSTPDNVIRLYNDLIEEALDEPVFAEALNRMPLFQLLPNCAPLNPVVALILWPLFRSTLSQNERSLFSFLNDYSPYGFQEFLQQEFSEDNPPAYQLNNLYDYITFTLGDSLFIGTYSRNWAEINYALDKISTSAPPLSREIVKIIGLLNLFGFPVGLNATSETIVVALNALENLKGVRRAIEYLEKSSIVIFRKFEQAYGLWEGSDVDLDSVLQEAQLRTRHGRISERLKEFVDLRPIVAKAHYIQKGTLRYFDVVVVDGNEEEIIKAIEEAKSADGKIIFVLSTNSKERKLLIDIASELTQSYPLKILAFPKPIKGLERTLVDLERWKWVRSNTPELSGDAVARNEVNARIRNTQQTLEIVAGSILGLRGHLFTPSASVWVQGGESKEIKTAIGFQRWLSALCEQVFSQAPSLHNELINRENLSSAAAAARRLLIQAMLEHEAEARLGIDGNPAHMSMYRSLLEGGGFHKKRSNGEISFGLPRKQWRPIWKAMNDFLKTTRTSRRPVLDLSEILKSPPYGLREGSIPVLLCALILSKRNQVALYEDGIFVPQLRIEVFELLMRVPESFEIQLYELKGTTQETFSAIGDVLNKLNVVDDQLREADLLEVVRPLVLLAARLPEYTKKTKRLEPSSAITVRDALLAASDPYQLLFQDLPNAVEESIKNQDTVRVFSARLEESLSALQRAYPKLLDEIESQFRDIFVLQGNATYVKNLLIERASPLDGYAVDHTLSLFIREAIRLDDRDWREVLARVVHGMPPEKWLDRDVVDFQLKLRQLSSDFVRLETLVQEQNASGASQIFRIGLLNGTVDELRAVVSILPEEEEKIEALVKQISEILDKMEVDSEDKNRLRIAALAQIASQYMDQEGDIS